MSFNIEKARKRLVICDYIQTIISVLVFISFIYIGYTSTNQIITTLIYIFTFFSVIIYIDGLTNIINYYNKKDELYRFVKKETILK